MDNIINNKDQYESILLKHSEYGSSIINGFELVKEFIKSNKRILYGGQALDYALRLKGSQIYNSEYKLPDYDFYSPDHIKDAYKLALELYKNKYKNIAIIRAIHITSVNVRINMILMVLIRCMMLPSQN